MNRDVMLDRVAGRKGPWDILVIGGGATGLGIALDQFQSRTQVADPSAQSQLTSRSA